MHLFFRLLLIMLSMTCFSEARSCHDRFSDCCVRPAHRGDEEAICDLLCEHSRCNRHSQRCQPIKRDKLRQFCFCDRPSFFVEVAEVEGKVIGFALFHFGFSIQHCAPILFIEDIFVKDSWRDRGIGSQLIKNLAHRAHENNCCRMECVVCDWNDAAITFFERVGGEVRRDLVVIEIEKKKCQDLRDRR